MLSLRFNQIKMKWREGMQKKEKTWKLKWICEEFCKGEKKKKMNFDWDDNDDDKMYGLVKKMMSGGKLRMSA